MKRIWFFALMLVSFIVSIALTPDEVSAKGGWKYVENTTYKSEGGDITYQPSIGGCKASNVYPVSTIFKLKDNVNIVKCSVSFFPPSSGSDLDLQPGQQVSVTASMSLQSDIPLDFGAEFAIRLFIYNQAGQFVREFRTPKNRLRVDLAGKKSASGQLKDTCWEAPQGDKNQFLRAEYGTGFWGGVCSSTFHYRWVSDLSAAVPPDEKPKPIQDSVAPPDEKPKPIQDSGARFSGINGQVEYWDPATSPPDAKIWDFAELDTVLSEGAHVKTEAESSCVLSFADMTTFVLKAESEVLIRTQGRKDTKLELLMGNMWINIKKMIRGEEIEIMDRNAVAVIKGTILLYTAHRDVSKVKVLEGVVLFTSKKDGRSVDVAAGNMASVNSRGILMTDAINDVRMKELWTDFRKCSTTYSGTAQSTPPQAPVVAQPVTINVSGKWTVIFNGTDKLSMTLQQSGEIVTGTLTTTDNSRPQITGRLEGRTLTLSRDTGLETIQHYQVTVEGSRFSGTFWNVGRFPSKGTFTGERR